MVVSSTATRTECACSHLTSFAILMHPSPVTVSAEWSLSTLHALVALTLDMLAMMAVCNLDSKLTEVACVVVYLCAHTTYS